MFNIKATTRLLQKLIKLDINIQSFVSVIQGLVYINIEGKPSYLVQSFESNVLANEWLDNGRKSSRMMNKAFTNANAQVIVEEVTSFDTDLSDAARNAIESYEDLNGCDANFEDRIDYMLELTRQGQRELQESLDKSEQCEIKRQQVNADIKSIQDSIYYTPDKFAELMTKFTPEGKAARNYAINAMENKHKRESTSIIQCAIHRIEEIETQEQYYDLIAKGDVSQASRLFATSYENGIEIER